MSSCYISKRKEFCAVFFCNMRWYKRVIVVKYNLENNENCLIIIIGYVIGPIGLRRYSWDHKQKQTVNKNPHNWQECFYWFNINSCGNMYRKTWNTRKQSTLTKYFSLIVSIAVSVRRSGSRLYRAHRINKILRNRHDPRGHFNVPLIPVWI